MPITIGVTMSTQGFCYNYKLIWLDGFSYEPLNAQNFYLIYKTGVKDLCITQDFFKNDIIVGNDSFLYTACDFFRGDIFVRGNSFFGRICLFYLRYLC